MSFAAWLLAGSAARGDALALADDRGSISYAVLNARVRATAARLRTLAAPRAIVPMFGETSIDLIVAYLGAMWAGLVPALVPPMSPAASAAVLAITGSELVVADAARAATFAGGLAGVIELAELAASPPSEIAAAEANRDEPALLLFTSGSTGAPRGVALSAHNLIASTLDILAAVPVASGERALSTLPVYYCYGTSIVHTHLSAGGAVIFAFGFPQDVVARIAPERIALLPGVPGLFEVLARRSTLGEGGAVPRRIMISGGRTSPTTLAAIRRRLPDTLISLRYGVTELTAAASFLAPELIDARAGSIGRGLPSSPLAVVRPDGAPVAPGEVGEIVARGPHVALGYYNDPEATREVFRDGAFHTGDEARIDDDGFIYVLGRRREFIKSAGHRISPHEIEDVIATHPAVAEVAVTSEPHELRGEIPIALVVLRAGATVAPGDLELHCRDALPAFKVPARAIIVAALPRTAAGKIRREALGALAAASR